MFDSRSWLLSESDRNENCLAGAFVDHAEQFVRYVPEWRRWLVFNGVRWVDDRAGLEALRMARDFATGLWSDVADLAQLRQCSREELTSATRFVHRCNSSKVLENVLRLAKADPRVLCHCGALNADISLLNCQNGTMNLISDEFYSHRRTDMLTQLACVDFSKDSTCPRWDQAIDLIFGGDGALIRYVKQLLGYALGGGGCEHVLPIAMGRGHNGKSFLADTIHGLLGDYATSAPMSLLVGDGTAHPTEATTLFAKRFVTMAEPEAGAKLREAQTKALTGDETIVARGVYQDFWSFKRTHLFWISSNYLPRIEGVDEGIWRRIKPIPFSVDLREKCKPIPNFHHKIVREEGSGVLNWLLEGWRDYRTNGFCEPESVKGLLQRYRRESDHLGQFIADRCLTLPDATVKATDLFNAYRSWGGNLTQTGFGTDVSRRFEKGTATVDGKRGVTIYRGISLL
jgi:putative DNA primase/helicase